METLVWRVSLVSVRALRRRRERRAERGRMPAGGPAAGARATHDLHRLQPAGADLRGPARERRATIAEVAHAFGISENHLVKVVHFLGQEGFLENIRGRGGGLDLAVPAGEINVGAVGTKRRRGLRARRVLRRGDE